MRVGSRLAASFASWISSLLAPLSAAMVRASRRPTITLSPRFPDPALSAETLSASLAPRRLQEQLCRDSGPVPPRDPVIQMIKTPPPLNSPQAQRRGPIQPCTPHHNPPNRSNSKTPLPYQHLKPTASPALQPLPCPLDSLSVPLIPCPLDLQAQPCNYYPVPLIPRPSPRYSVFDSLTCP